SMASILEPELSREMTAARAPLKKRWPLYAGIAGVAIALGIVIAILTVPHGGPDGPDPGTPAGKALEALEQGAPARALQILEANKMLVAGDPQGQRVLGLAHAARNERMDALAAFRRALDLQPDLESDSDLRANLRAMAADKTPDVVTQAFELWVARTSDGEAKRALVKAAVSEDLERRHAALPVVIKLK